MKKFVLFALGIFGSVAFAQTIGFDFPDFSLQTKYEMNYISHDASVKNYVRRLGATSFTVNQGKPAIDMYAVTTNNGCSFDVQVVYASWPGVDDLVISDARCN